MRRACAAAFLVWLAWTGVVAWHYFARPAGEVLVFLDGRIEGFPYWREAAYRALRACLGAGATALAMWTLGRGILSAIAPGAAGAAERLVWALALGASALGSALFALAGLRLYTPRAVSAVIVVLASAGALWIVRAGITRPALTIPRARHTLLLGCTAAAAGFALVGALAPETEYDALWYHLWLPAQWLEAGRPVDILDEYISLYPLGWDLVGGAAMALGGPVAAKLLHFLCLPLLGITTSLLTRALFPDASAALAAALAVATPIVMWEATTAYVDLALAWLLSASVYALVRYDASRQRRFLLLAALLMGGALAAKHLALVALLIASAVLLIRELQASRQARTALIVTALFGVIAVALPAPWYLRAYAASGNPVFPDLYRVFGARPPERWSQAAESGLQRFKDRFGTPQIRSNPMRLPWDATVHAAAFGGTLGPLFLVLVPAALIGRNIRRQAIVLGLCSAAYVAVWASPLGSLQMRFLVPLVPGLAALGAEGAARVERAARHASRGGPAVVFTTVLALLLLNLPPATPLHEPDRRGWTGWMTHILRGAPAAVVLGAESESEYLARKVPSYRAWRHVDAALPPDARVLTFSGGDHLYSTRRRLSSDAVRARAATWGASAADVEAALAALRRLRVTHVLTDRRQLEDGSLRELAIGSSAMLACCLEPEYTDARYVLYRVLPDDGAPGTLASPEAATDPEAAR